MFIKTILQEILIRNQSKILGMWYIFIFHLDTALEWSRGLKAGAAGAQRR